MSKKDKGAKKDKKAGKGGGGGFRWVAILMVSLLLWSPAGMATAAGTMTLDAALLRYAIALALSWVGVSTIARIMDSYAREQERKRLDEEVEAAADAGAATAAEGEPPRRRAEDRQ